LSDSDLFDFLAKNQQTLTWLGGGVATAAGGAWIVIKYFLNRDGNEDRDNSSAKEKSGTGTHVTATSGLAAGRDLRVGDNISIQQSQVSKAGLVLAVIGLLLLGVAVMNAGHNVTVSNGSNYVGGSVTNSQVGATTIPLHDKKSK
jgi:hypothetical protein